MVIPIISILSGIGLIYVGVIKTTRTWQTLTLYILGVGLIYSGAFNI